MAEIRVPYSYDGRAFEGALVYDDSVTGQRPAILMQPDWLGVAPHTIEMARDVAGKDYVVMVADMFGAGYTDREKTFDELLGIVQEVRNDLPFILGCAAVADKALRAEAQSRGLIDDTKTAAIGYCIGAGFALEQARAGADYKCIVAFHVTAPNPVDPKAKPDFKGRVLAFHGAADPVTPKDKMDLLADELSEAGVDWQIMMYGHANHGFCDLASQSESMQYDEKLCKQSYRIMREFFAETWQSG